ncbi:hypothetical protein H6P81_005203 [Aristolochia fimbriata]|uniref:UDP-N-acetylglucosamine transferase subunit ALG14 n=1 Tax=Aristolochia fimbriata TaxID=158543 RepID=A0AAV7EUV2_ARIFI|nr:hypothetical protein H6P81_005203 [Aristolochia fimbriata]
MVYVIISTMDDICNISMLAIIVSAVVVVVSIRVAFVLYKCGKPLHVSTLKPVSTLIVLGSGGHTAEMLNLIKVLKKERFNPRYYIAAMTDNMSLEKAKVLEESTIHETGARDLENARFMQIYRSREVGQSYVTSIGTTLIAMAHAMWLIIKIRPQVILCNGPGTCIPLCAAAFLLKIAGIRWSSIFYVESIARVRKLSLSGLLLYKSRLADQFFVQWPQLQRKYPRAQYVGCIM